MNNDELSSKRNEAHYCPECGEHLMLHTDMPATMTEPPERWCPVERYTENYKPRDQGSHDHRSLIDFWANMDIEF